MTSCGACDLKRSNQTRDFLKSKSPCQLVYIKESKFTCLRNNKTCNLYFSLNEVKQLNHCLMKALILVPVEYIFGVLAILSNIFVLLVTLGSAKLRTKVPFFLIANIAIADLLIGAYSVSTAAGHNRETNSNIRKARSWRLNSCPYIRSVLVIGEFVGVAASLVLSIERYIAIVYWKKPQLRLSLNKAFYIIAACWVAAIGECVLLQLYNPGNITDSYMCVLIRNIDITRGSLQVGQLFTGTLVIIYIVLIIFYAKMLLFLRRKGTSRGIERETQMIRRIAAILFTNGLFFVGSNLLLLYLSVNVPSGTLGSDSVLDFMVRHWLPPMCMVLNACLDPFFYAYKNTLFLDVLKELKYSLRESLAKSRPEVDTIDMTDIS